MVGAFGFIIGALFYPGKAVVFKNIASATLWKLFQRTIPALAILHFGSHHLPMKHKEYLDMVRWSDSPDALVTSVPVQHYLKNKGIIREDGTKEPSHHTIYVDNNLMADTKRRLARALVAAIEAIFTITGVSNLLLCPCAVVMDKWININLLTVHILLRLRWNMREVRVGITLKYRLETVHLLHTVWHDGRESFLIGKLEWWF